MTVTALTQVRNDGGVRMNWSRNLTQRGKKELLRVRKVYGSSGNPQAHDSLKRLKVDERRHELADGDKKKVAQPQ